MTNGRDTYVWSWQDEAPCKRQVALFFAPPAEREPARLVRVAQALAMCNSCPFIGPCDEEATRRNEQHGIWGGKPRGADAAPRSKRGRKPRCEE